MPKRFLKVWIEVPYGGIPPIEEIVELAEDDDPDVVGEDVIEEMYLEHFPGGWDVIDEEGNLKEK